MISYGQNHEDVVLWRALRNVDPTEGFWIDVGAADPELESVTKHFSGAGWRGVNIEPLPDRFRRLLSIRTRDINLEVALGEQPGRAQLSHVLDADGLSSIDPTAIERLRGEGHPIIARDVAVTTLVTVCDAHAPKQIHFLKIDVEGHERAVIAGGDWARFRPWIVVVEATRPEEWERLLTSFRYLVTLHDGLNLWFVADEHRHLEPLVRRPANVTDGYTPAREEALRRFALAYAAPTIARDLLRRWVDPGAAEIDAATALADAVCGRPDVLTVFEGSNLSRPGELDLAGILRWATTDSPDATVKALAVHRGALLRAC